MGYGPTGDPRAWPPPQRPARPRAPSWSPEPPPSPVRGLPVRLRASQEALGPKDWPPPVVDMDPLIASLPPPPVGFYPGTWSPRPEHLPLTADTVPIVLRDHHSPGSMSATLTRHSTYIVDPHAVRHAAGCPAHRASAEIKTESRPGSRPPSRPSSRAASRPSSRATSRPTSRSASRSGSRSASRSGHRSGYSSPGSDLR